MDRWFIIDGDHDNDVLLDAAKTRLESAKKLLNRCRTQAEQRKRMFKFDPYVKKLDDNVKRRVAALTRHQIVIVEEEFKRAKKYLEEVEAAVHIQEMAKISKLVNKN